MSLKKYGVLAGRVLDTRAEGGSGSPHFQIRVRGGDIDFRVAVNVLSQQSPSELLYAADEAFDHPVLKDLLDLPDGFSHLQSGPGQGAFDYIRGNLFDRESMHPLPATAPGPDNDLADKLHHYVDRVQADPAARLYAFGERWGPENGRADKIFGFAPGNGVHDIHMNQGNSGQFQRDDGVWQDGGLLLHFPAAQQWVAIFLAFQSQSWHTDDRTGRPLPGLQAVGPLPGPGEPDHAVRIVAALVNNAGSEPSGETVTLLNTGGAGSGPRRLDAPGRAGSADDTSVDPPSRGRRGTHPCAASGPARREGWAAEPARPGRAEGRRRRVRRARGGVGGPDHRVLSGREPTHECRKPSSVTVSSSAAARTPSEWGHADLGGTLLTGHGPMRGGCLMTTEHAAGASPSGETAFDSTATRPDGPPDTSPAPQDTGPPAASDPPDDAGEHPPHRSGAAALMLAALGIVFGDIGTSPLYALKTVFSIDNGAVRPTEGDVYGVISMMFWSVTLIVSIKYISVLMRADNDGEGGVMALTALVRRLYGDRTRRTGLFVVIGILGVSLFYGDSLITPAISVLSAVEGVRVAAPTLGHVVVPVSVVIITVLFAVQRFGTGKVGSLFGPVMLLWFLTLAVAGIAGIVAEPGVLKGLSPTYAVLFVVEHPGIAFVAMGAIVLVITGAEALYADMGHFGRHPLRRAWFSAVSPGLPLNYLGRAPLTLRPPGSVPTPFFLLAPSGAQPPRVLLATAATVIASQAVISGAFSLSRQAVQLGLLPPVTVRQTSKHEGGQIYLPGVNGLLFAGVLLVMLTFRSSE